MAPITKSVAIARATTWKPCADPGSASTLRLIVNEPCGCVETSYAVERVSRPEKEGNLILVSSVVIHADEFRVSPHVGDVGERDCPTGMDRPAFRRPNRHCE